MDNITIQHILNRRSIRKYQEKEVPKEVIKQLLQAAMNAPSACNQQSRHFILIDDQEILIKLSEIHGGYHTIAKAPAVIVVCGEPDLAVLKSFWEHDCAAAAENILIAAEALGLGAIWMGVNPAPEAKEEAAKVCRYLSLPEHIKPFSIIACGYPAETIPPRDNYKESKIHYNNIW